MKNLKIALVGFAALLVANITTPSFAGWGIGITGSDSDFTARGNETLGTSGKVTGGTDSESATVPSFFLEYTDDSGFMTVGLDVIPFSAEIAAYSKSDTDLDAGSSSTSTSTGSIDVKNLITAYVEPTYSVGGVSLFGKLGVRHVTVEGTSNLMTGGNYNGKNDNLFGVMYGAGIKMDVYAGTYAKLAWTNTYYDEGQVEATEDQGQKNRITVIPQQEEIRLSLGYKF